MFKPHALFVGVSLIAGMASADIIFSEYIEGSSNNKALELLNTGSTSVDLSTVSVELYSNGNLNPNNQVTLSGTLDAGRVYVIANSSAVPEITDIADITSSVTFFNGNDALVLRQNGVVVDRIGQVGNSDSYGSNVTLVRNDDIVTGDPQFDTPFDATAEWTSYPQNTFTFLGNGDSSGGGGTEPPADLTCADPATLISEIQGSGDSSPLEGQSVIVEAIVVSDLQASNQMSGFFIQEEDADADADASTSEGLFVFHSNDDVSVGDAVRIQATVDEFYGLTQINQVQQLVVCSSGNVLPSVAPMNLPLEIADAFEAVEGMQVEFADTLTVNEVYNLGRFGEFLVSNGRRFIPTDIATPGPEADAVRAANQLNALIVEDGIRDQNPDPVAFPAPGLSADNTLRVGDTLNNLTGVMNYAFGAYKVIPSTAPVFNGDNPRTDAPEIIEDSELRLASFNVLNFFNGDGLGGGFPTPRGADDAEELVRQTAKLVAAINAMDADIVGLMELENDGFGELSAIAELTNALNVELGAEDQYAYVDAGVTQIGDDDIAVGMIYRPSVVDLVGVPAILSSENSPLNDSGEPLFVDDLNRPALTQTFVHSSSGEVMTIVVNHFKSKGPRNCDDRGDCDVGQGAYNIARTNAATALSQWLETNPTGIATDNVMVIGDLNAYSKEDPVSALLSAGFSLLKQEGGYSYVFSGETGSLDHALASTSLLDNVLNVQDWHINTDEPRALDYNLEFKSDAQDLSLYAPTPFRSSDHDPVIVDFGFNQAPEASFKTYNFWFWYIFVSTSMDPDGDIVSETWSLGDYDIHSSYFFVPKRFVYRNGIKEVTLTVEDDQGAVDSLTKAFR